MADLLGWFADRILETQDEREDERIEPTWGPDATGFPPAYWHWTQTWRQFRETHHDPGAGPLPMRGPVLSLVVPVGGPGGAGPAAGHDRPGDGRGIAGVWMGFKASYPDWEPRPLWPSTTGAWARHPASTRPV